MQPISRETVVERRQTHLRWSAIFAGAVFAVGIWVLLQSLGTGLGLTVIDTSDRGNLRGVGIGTGIWSLVCPLIAIFCGGLVVGRMAGARDRMGAAIHGAVMWSLVTVVGLWAVASIVSTLAGGVVRLGGEVASATSGQVSTTFAAGARVDPTRTMFALGVNADDLLAPVNTKLQREGKPPITADQLGAALRGIAQRGIREGRLVYQIVVDEITRNTALAQPDAAELANQLGARFDQLSMRLQQRMRRFGDDAKTTALDAANDAGKSLLYGGLMLLLSLVAAVGGAAAAGRREVVRMTTSTTTTYPPPAPIPSPPIPPPPIPPPPSSPVS